MSEPLPAPDAVTRCLERIRHLATPTDDSHWVADPPAVAAAEKLLAERPGLAQYFRIHSAEDGGITIDIVPGMGDVERVVGISASGEIEIYQFNVPHQFGSSREFPALDAEALAFLDGLIGGAT